MSNTPTALPPAETLPFTLQKDEGLLIVVRRHWLYFTLRLVGVGAAGILGTVLAIIVVKMTFGFDGTPGLIAIGAIVLWALYWLVRG